MADNIIRFSLAFSGALANENRIDLYDVSQALVGFQRSLALTTHLILNNEVITQAPSLEGAQVLATPAETGSWKLTAVIVTTIFTLGTAPRDTPIGNLVSSAYDYVINETLGFHVDYKKTLGQQYEELKRKHENALPILDQTRFDSLIEKCEVAIRDMHRPIVWSETAQVGNLTAQLNRKEYPVGHTLNRETFDYIRYTVRSDEPSNLVGRVSSYNINTYKGRIFIADENRPIPFELAPDARTRKNIARLTNSLTINAEARRDAAANIEVVAFKNSGRSGRLKTLFIIDIE